MSKIILCKLSKKSNYKKIENVEENVEENKTIINNKSISEKKSYLQLLDKIKTSLADSKTSVTDLSATIIHMYDNYEEQLLCLHKLLNGVVFDEKKYFIQALKNKLDSYKQQDKKKTYDAYDNFITLENIIEKLVAYNMRCYYCNSKTLILFKNVRTNYQWTLDRLNNYDEHSNANTVICCLKCNLQRRRKNSEKFKFTKQLEHNLLLLKKID
jgi:tRNA-dihydrouridine synthase